MGRDRVLYLPLEPVGVEQPIQAVLSDQVELAGYRLKSETASPGETISLDLFWRGLRTMDRSYTVFTHLVGPDGQIWGQQDGVPACGLLPTNTWRPGVLVPAEHAIPAGPDPPPGNYELRTGMYELASGQRLLAVDASGARLADDSILLTQITVR